MQLEFLVDALKYASVAAFFLSLPVIYLLVKIKVSKTKYNHELQRVELGALRASLEESIYKINEKFQKDPAGWEELNHLLVDGNKKGDAISDANEGRDFSIGQMRFIKNLGVDLSSVGGVEDKVFLITPFHDSYKDEYLAIKDACSMVGLECVRGDEVFKEGNILRHIVEEILRSKYIIANLNGRNPNVYYEVGIAHCLGKDVMLLSSSVDEVQFDLKNHRILTFASLAELKSRLYVKLVQSRKG